jgi:glycosyltransferase involved in cell wall biosynthesis
LASGSDYEHSTPRRWAAELTNGANRMGTKPDLTGQNIVCFSKDWSEDPTSNNHVVMQLAKHNRVLWLNSIGTRVPRLTSGRDLRKIWKKFGDVLRGPTRVAENLWVYTPVVLPLPHSRWATVLNRIILRAALGVLRRRLGMRDFQMWTFLPNVGDYVGRLGESLVVYYCVDEWSQFNYVDGTQIAAAEERLCRRADIVFATAESLVRRKLAWNKETHLARHGVDHALFSRALEPATTVPQDVASLSRPVIGFYGTLQDWVDQDLIAHLATRHPEWSIVLIGKPMVDLSRIEKFPNVHVLGRRSHGQLPQYCKAFSVGIIPYVLHDRIIHVNPIKLREYLSAGLPVVSVDLPEAAVYREHCTIARSYEEFERGIEEALRTDSSLRRGKRAEAMRNETWVERVSEVGAHVMRVKRSKCHPK